MSKMLIGFNNDVEYNGRMFHIQTEDNGIKNASITTILFFSGQILESKRTEYKDVLETVEDSEEQKKAIKKKMVDQHRTFYKKLFEGNYEDRVAAMTGEKGKSGSVKKASSYDPNFKPATLLDDVNDNSAVKDPKPKIKRGKVSKSSKKGKVTRVRHLGRPDHPRQAFRGIMWPRDELRLDGLVAHFLDTQ